MACKGCEQRREAIKKWTENVLKRRERARAERERRDREKANGRSS